MGRHDTAGVTQGRRDPAGVAQGGRRSRERGWPAPSPCRLFAANRSWSAAGPAKLRVTVSHKGGRSPDSAAVLAKPSLPRRKTPPYSEHPWGHAARERRGEPPHESPHRGAARTRARSAISRALGPARRDDPAGCGGLGVGPRGHPWRLRVGVSKPLRGCKGNWPQLREVDF